MGTGINQVYSANKRGGLRLATGKVHIMGLTEIALSACDSDNPFQDIGLGEDMIFDPLDLKSFIPVQDKIREIFESFVQAELATLAERPDNLQISQTAEGEAMINVFVIDLETDDEFTMSVVGTNSGVVVRAV